MFKVNIKPLSSNQAWQGRRFKSKLYKSYEKRLLPMLPKAEIPSGKLHICISVAFSNKQSDIDNILKPFIDVLQKKYSFNDNMIYKLSVIKTICKKGDESIAFKIMRDEDN